ncbi:hypothetical protein QW060_02820 [Myroides ceti]|uniref:Uncharacterized protein n=1 Tax=Paenimyroides ceti TaxID=395087 RepID=A0ABT8CQV6_9FLAO|nr:hypothetical protein [Paenimyroides ceti]MDN3706058.1 hypothetical protein [Paenimyroides ceti]
MVIFELKDSKSEKMKYTCKKINDSHSSFDSSHKEKRFFFINELISEYQNLILFRNQCLQTICHVGNRKYMLLLILILSSIDISLSDSDNISITNLSQIHKLWKLIM